MALLAIGLAACGQDQAEPTVEQQLEAIKGRDLRPSEVEDLETVADTTCQLESPLLETIWEKLEVTEFEFQDFIIKQRCPERAVEYALATGRVVTEEARAQTAGITLPSSTLPTTTTQTTRPSTQRSTTTESDRDPTHHHHLLLLVVVDDDNNSNNRVDFIDRRSHHDDKTRFNHDRTTELDDGLDHHHRIDDNHRIDDHHRVDHHLDLNPALDR